MQIFIYKNIENNKHSFENLAKFCCFKEAISNFLILLHHINRDRNYLPELIYLNDIDSIIFKSSKCNINIKENISVDSNNNCISIYVGSNREFLHSFKRLNFPNEIYVCCYFLTSLKILDVNKKSFFLIIDEDIIDICYHPFLNIFSAVSNSKIFVYKNQFENLLYDSCSDLKRLNSNNHIYNNKQNYILNNSLIYETCIDNIYPIQIEEICNNTGQIFAGYNLKSNKIYIFEENQIDLDICYLFIKKENFQLIELNGHEGNIINVKKHENYSRKNNILISLCNNNRLIIWNVFKKEILKKFDLDHQINSINFFIFEMQYLRNDCIFLFSNEMNKLKLLNINTGAVKDLFVNTFSINRFNKYKFLVNCNQDEFFCVEINNDNLFSVSKYSFKIKENFLC